MSDIIIQANKNSVILSSLDKNHRSDLSYKHGKNYPMLSKQMIELQPNIAISGAPAGKELLFTLPRYGLLTGLTVRSAITTGATDTHDALVPIGLTLFESIELRSHNKVICSNSDAYLRARVDQLPFEQSWAWKRRVLGLVSATENIRATPTWGAATAVTYTPFFCAFFEEPKMYLDLAFVEQLQLRCVCNTAARTGLDAAISAQTSTLWMTYYNMESSALAELRAKNFKPEMPLNMVTYDTYTETGTLVDNATSTTIRLNVNNAVFASHVFLRNNAASGDAALASITQYTVNMGGRTLYNGVPTLMGQLEGDKFSVGVNYSTVNAVSLVDVKPISIYWGLEPGERTWNSGAVSFNNVNTPQIVISHSDPGTVIDYYVVHEYFTITTINPSDGSVIVSSSI